MEFNCRKCFDCFLKCKCAYDNFYDDRFLTLSNKLKGIDGIHSADSFQVSQFVQCLFMVTYNKVGITALDVNDSVQLSKYAHFNFAVKDKSTSVNIKTSDIIMLQQSLTSYYLSYLSGRFIYINFRILSHYQYTLMLSTIFIEIIGIFAFNQSLLAVNQMLLADICFNSLALLAVILPKPVWDDNCNQPIEV